MNATKQVLQAAMAGVLLSSAAYGQDLAVPVKVREPAGVAREAFPATGGIPFKPGLVKRAGDLALYSADGKPVPAQFTELMKYDDGSVQWALVDVLVDLPAGGSAEFLVKPGKAAPPASPLEIVETDAAVTVDTGVVAFTVSKIGFNLFDRVTVDGKPVATGGEVSVTGATGVWYKRLGKGQWEERTTATHPGETFTAGRPRRVLWEYRGPLRATLRVDGDYQKNDETWLGYTTRITAWAGSGLVRVEHAIRNSNPETGADAYIGRAALSLELAADFKPQGRGENWAAGGDGQAGLMVQNWHSAGIYRGPSGYHREVTRSGWLKDWKPLYKQQVAGKEALVEIISKGPELGDTEPQNRGALGFTKDGVYALADRARKESEVWYDFYAGDRDAAANEVRALACRSKLLVVAPGEYYGETGALSIGPFGTLADEIAAYRKWGWKGWDDPGKQPKVPTPGSPGGAPAKGETIKPIAERGSTHLPNAYIPVEPVHEVTEGDSVEGYLVMWLRTGMRGYFDWGEAMAGYFRGQAIYRRDWGPRWGTDHGYRPTRRFVDPEKKIVLHNYRQRPLAEDERGTTGQSFGWFSPHCFDWWDARMHYCHHYASGLLDYYCITGQVDAREAMLDLAEEMSRGYNMKVTVPGKPFAFKRTLGRMWITMISAWRATRDPKWKRHADQLGDYALKAPNWDAELSYYRMPIGNVQTFVDFYCKGHLETDRNFPYLRDIPPKLDAYLTEHDIKAVYRDHKLTVHKGDQTWSVYNLQQTFEVSVAHMAMERYARVFDSDPMKKRFVACTAGMRKLVWSDKTRHAIYSGVLGWPEKDMVCAKSLWQDTPAISGWSTRFLSDIFARAYTFSRDEKFLEWAKEAWSRGSKRGYRATEQFAGPDEVGQFATIWGSHHDDCLETCARLFYEVRQAK